MKHPTSSVPAALLVLTLAAACADPVAPPAALDPDHPSLESSGAERSYFFEETAQAFWAVPHACADGSTVQASLLVSITRDFESPETEDANPTARLQYQAVCPGGLSYSWVGAAIPATITSADNLTSVTASGAGAVRDIFGVTHQVSFDVAWTGHGALETTVRTTSLG
jgi:hypothetical protein